MIKLLLPLLLIIPIISSAKSSYSNRLCKIYFSNTQQEKVTNANSDLERLLKEKNYKLINFSEPPQFKMGRKRDYLSIKVEKQGGFFPPCKVTLTIKRTKSAFTSDGDKAVWSSDALRRLPRTTISGDIRCQYAVKDALGNLPKCD